MLKRQKMLLKILPIILSFGLLIGCEDKPDAYLCVFIQEPGPDGILKQYSYCINSKTKDEKYIDVKDMKNWITTSPDDYEKMRDWYKSQCK